MLTALLVVLVCIFALLAIPLGLRFGFEWPDSAANHVEVEWAFGLVRSSVPLGKQQEDASGSKDEATVGSSDKSSSLDFFAAIRKRRFRQRLYAVVGKLWRAVEKRDVRLRACIGLGDPADTGQLWAVLGPLSAVLASVKSAQLSIEPDFVDEALEFEGSGHVRLVPLRIIAIAVGLFASPAFWRDLRPARAT